MVIQLIGVQQKPILMAHILNGKIVTKIAVSSQALGEPLETNIKEKVKFYCKFN